MQPKWIKKHERGVLLFFKAQPRSSKTEIVGLYGEDYLKVKIRALPESGKANEELIEYLSKFFKVAKSRVFLIHGHSSALKTIQIENLFIEEAQEILNKLLNKGL